MPFDLSDHKQAVAERKDRALREAMPQLRMVQAVAPVMQAMLTTSDHWNRYLTFLQGQVDRIKLLKDTAHARLAGHMVWDYADLVKLKSDVLRADCMIETLMFCMNLPKAIIDDGHKVDAIISKFEGQDEAPA